MKSLKELYRIGKGPSSSHTMGPNKAAKDFAERHLDAASFEVTLYGSLAATGKGHMTDVAIIEVLERIAPQQPSEFIFSNKGKPITQGGLRYTFAKAVSILGLNDGITDRRYKVVFHTLRHTFCSWLASKNVPLYTIGTLVGHKNTRSTQRYAKLSPDAKWEALKLIEQTATDHKS